MSTKSNSPKNGDVKLFNGVRFIHNGHYWLLDEILDIIDRHHNYSGFQDPKKPYRGAREAHLICGTKLCR
jgi:hypothetical protein